MYSPVILPGTWFTIRSMRWKVGHINSLIDRAIRHVFPRSKERYYSPDNWNDSWSHGYDLNIVPEDGRYGVLMALLRRYEGKGPLLDVGCGDGLLEQWYRNFSGVKILAFDYSSAAVEHARTRRLLDVDFVCADSRTFQASEQFSTIVFNESLYYIDDYLGVMKDLSSRLQDNGVFVVSMHDGRIPNRIWKNVLRSYKQLQGVAVKDESTGGLWRIRVLQPSK
jgi:2-polyprenyl-3-methyl-5-hydroxy-6-metoxy-1,4-benzoquinol methylase